MRVWSVAVAMLSMPPLWAGCADDEHREENVERDGAQAAVPDAGGISQRDSSSPRDATTGGKLDSSAVPGTDARPGSASDASDASDAPSHTDGASPAQGDAAASGHGDASPASGDAASPEAPDAREVAAILANRCGSCHQNQGSDGFLFDGRLRATLFAAVEAPPTPAGDPPGATACRKELRVVRGDANSYLIRKMELGLGRQPSPPVCGNGMPADTALDDIERGKLAIELDHLKRWIVVGAPLE